jgi:acetyl/propionyl-CoA carboxylase alpha subunit
MMQTYVNAGTVEFVMDPKGGFYFLEMNTRLQVEHPVTELVTGLDLVDLQLRIATGEHLPFDQAGVQLSGWAMEARICAEDPARGFTPATGMITRYAEPRGDAVRVDSGVDTGSKIGVHYDSMLAKVICHGTDREDARTRLIEALNAYHIEGVVTNIDFANSVLCQPAFAAGELDTGFIDLTRLFEVYRPEEWVLIQHMPKQDEAPPSNELLCPMPGLVVDVPVKQGDCVNRGQNLVTLESMKMESGVASPVDGMIDEVFVAPGHAVEAGDVLVRFVTSQACNSSPN